MFFKQRVLLMFNTGTDDQMGKMVKLHTVPRIGERFSLNIVDSGEVTNVIWGEDQYGKIYPTVYIDKGDKNEK